MSKIIIHNNSKMDDYEALDRVNMVIAKGFVSGDKQFCWHTHWRHLNVSICAMPTRGETHTFKVIDEVMD